MLAEQLSLEGVGRPQQGHRRHKFTAVEEMDCPIGDIMSVPLDRLCQLAWPLLCCREGENLGKPFRVPPFSQTDADDAQLARVIVATATETIRFFRMQLWWGQLSCHTLRTALFQKALHAMLTTSAVIPSGQSADSLSPAASALAPQNLATEERAPLGGVEATGLKSHRGSFDGSSTDEVSPGKARIYVDKRRVAPMDWVLPYLSGQEDERWLSERVREMVDMTFLPHNEYQKQLVSNAAYVSVHAQHHKRGAQVFLFILREVLERWNAATETTGEFGIFAFGVLLPIIDIVRCTKFNNTDMVTVGKLLETVRFPSRGRGLSSESLSKATFVTRYNLSLGESMMEKDVDENEDEEQEEEEETGGRSPQPHTSLPPLLTRWGMLLGDQMLRERTHKADYGHNAIASTMVTDMFLMAPLARKVSVYVRRASYCEGVQLVLLPRASIAAPCATGSAAAGDGPAGAMEEREAEVTENDDVQPIKPVWFEPLDGETHELIGGCDAMLRYKRSSEGSAHPRLQAEVRVETSLEVDGRWVVELWNALSGTQLLVAESLLQRVRNGFTSGDGRMREESLVLFRNGLLSQPRTNALPTFVMELLTLDEDILRRRVTCRQSDARGVRAALSLIGMFLANHEVDQLSWESRIWQDAVKRVSLASSSLGRNPGATELATFVLEHVAPCHLSMPQIVEGTIAFLTSNISVGEVRTMLSTQRARAELCVLALSLLLRAKENFVPKGMFYLVSLLQDFMVCEGTHYLSHFQGCGESLEEEIRELVHRLLTSVFGALHRIMSLPEGERERHGPHRFLWDADDFGPFALVTLSLLASPLDARDIDFVWRKIASQVEGLLPNFTDLSRSASFKVSEREEGSMLEALRALVNDSIADHSNSGATGHADQPFIGMTMTGASERGIGVWVPTGRDRFCSTVVPLYTPGSQVSTSHIFSASSSTSVPLVNGSPLSPSTFCVAEVELLSMPSRDLIVALTTKQPSGLTAYSMKDDPNGFYFFPNEGTLHHNGSQVSLPPIFQGDALAFSFSFKPKTSTRVLRILLNGIRILEFPAPRHQLFLVAGVTDVSTLRSSSFRVCFRPYKGMSLGASTVVCGNNDAVVNGLPTRHSISVFATNVFFYLISFCARRVTQFRRQGGAASASLQAACPANSGARTFVPHTEEVWRGFVDDCCNPLRQNVESLIESIKRLPPLSQINDATERVKRNAASFVYHRFLMDYITMIRTAIRCSLSPVEMLSTLSRVVCCEDVGERERCAALTIACSILCDPHRGIALGTYNPLQLWDCCRSLSRHVTELAYNPVFTMKSAAAELTVFSGGRRLKSVSASHSTSRAMRNTTSFASQGIPLDGSLGEVVAFSVRLQRGFACDTLGRFYYIGLACLYPMSSVTTLSSYPGDWQSIVYTYAITDYFTDVSSPSARSELPRHAKNWMSNEENIIFGSGDVITVIVHTKLRCISFERNGLSLGTLYTNIPSMVKVLFPFVELFNKDAAALFLYTPREIGIRARFAMRAMLYHWGTELIPRLNEMLKANDVVALQVLGADGDEMCFWYRNPPRGELKGSRVVRLVRQLGSKAEVVVEGTTKSMTVLAAALEPNYNVVISNDLPATMVVDELMRIVSTSISFTTNSEGCDGVHIRPTKMFLCALRLLSEMELMPLFSYDVEALRALLIQLIRVLGVPDAISSEGQYILLEAWNELMLLPDDDELWISIPHDAETNDVAMERDHDMDNNETEGGIYDICLRCPTCDKEWGNCTSETHVTPYSPCFTLHCVLQRLGVPSPFTGFICEWYLPKMHFCVTIRMGPHGEIEGEGEEPRGIFTFSAKYVSNQIIRGSCAYKCAENFTTRSQMDEEWACELCTFINLADSTRCAMCTTARPGATWTCLLCGYAFNSKNNNICTTCGHQRMGATETDSRVEKKLAYCEGCGEHREYTTFDDFVCHFYCEHCQRASRWLPEEKYTGLIEATLVGAGDTMDWVIILGDNITVYSSLKNDTYSLEAMKQAAELASPGASDLSRYVPPLVQVRTTGTDASNSSSALQQQQQQQQEQEHAQEQEQEQEQGREHSRGVVSAVLFFCSCIVCRWGPDLAPEQLANMDLLRRLRVLDDSWLTGLEKIPSEAARGIFSFSLRVLLAGTSSEQVIRSLSSISRVLMNSHPTLQTQRHYLLYALCVNAMRGSGDRAVREACYAALNALIEESSGQRLNANSLRDVVAITPVVAEQQRLMVHASLRGVDVSSGTNVISTSWLIEAVERMERRERLPAIFDEPSPDIFPYLVELPDTRMGEGGELIVGQVRGSVGVFASKGGRYYYELVIPANFSNDRSKTIIMGWGTMQHEVLSSGQHVGSDIHSWGFNCQDRLRVLTGEQAISTPRPIVGSDVIGALLDLDAMMMCWSVNGEQLMWVAVSTQGKGEAIYPFVSASVEPLGVVVRLGHTQFKPDGYEDFSPFSHEMARRESHVKPQSYEFYAQLCSLGNDIVNCGFTLDSLLDTSAWFDRAQEVITQYPLLSEEMAEDTLEGLRPYFQHLRSINSLAISVAKSHDILRNSPYLMRRYQKTRQLLFFSARWAIVERQIERRLIRSKLRHHREVLIDLNRAKAMAQSSESLDFMTRFEGSITGQLFRQTRDADIYLDAVMFVISLAGEVADDAGGVTRSVVTMMCDELNYREEDDGRRVDPLLPFFRLTGHTTMVGVVPNMDFYRENPEHRLLFVEVFTWLGKLIGNATMSGYLMFSFTFPRLLWKFLTFDNLTIEDYHADIDDTVRGALNDDEFILNDEFFYSIPGIEWSGESVTDTMGMVRSTRGYPVVTPTRSTADMASIFPTDGHEESVTVAQRRKEAERALLHQYDELLLAMLSGITFVLPASSLQLIRWDDLQQRVCGNSCATAEDVISSLDLSLLSEELCHMLKEVVHAWPQQRRSQFLLFCSGQRRIPLPEKVQVACGDDPIAIPTAHTCSPISLLLHPYPSVAVLREKLEVCLRHVYEFGFA
ncbi:hypothetical protein TcCL_ESM05033 [Trypanosoma cruzi]|nr:hypothetical protein TcCL_ESM05033 [Trypanosoma cruzi]